MVDKITVIKNQITQYEVMHHFRKSLSSAFERRGIEVELIDISKLTKSELFQTIYRASPDYTLAFNGLQPKLGDQFLSDELQIPHVAWLVDSAHYFDQMAKGAFNLIISPDQYSADQHRSWGSSHSYFLPHAFEAALATPPGGERPFPIVFLGTLLDPTEIHNAWKRSMPPNHVDAMVRAAETVLKDPNLSYQEALKDMMEKDPSFWGPLTFSDLKNLYISFDLYVRARDRIELLKSLEGLPVHIFGNTQGKARWEDFLDVKKGDYTIHPAVDFPQSVEIMKQAQIVLNSSPMFKTGAHERIFYGLGSGAAVLTNKTAWIHDHYIENEEILLYDFKSNANREKIEELLFHPEKLVQIAQKGQEKVMKQDTWDQRAASLLDIMEKEYEKFQ